MRSLVFFLVSTTTTLMAQDSWEGFSIHQVIPTNGRSYSIKVAHVNHDDFADLIVLPTEAFDQVRIYTGNTEAEFDFTTTVTKQENYRVIETGDLNGDGIDDLVISGYWNNGFKLFWGIGNGAFEEGDHYALTGHGKNIKVVDYNKDGALDVMALSGGSGQTITLHVFAGNNTKTLQAKGVYQSTLHTDRAITIVDKNQDGLLDVMVSSSFPWFIIFYQDVSGNFVPRFWPRELQNPFTSVYFLADLNNDSREDVIAHYTGEGFRFYEGLQDTLFSEAYTAMPTALHPYRLYTQDINADGNVDMVMDQLDPLTDELSDTLLYFLGKGDFTFHAPIKISFPGAIEYFTLQDVSGDSFPDLIASCKGVGIVTAYNVGRVTGVEVPVDEDAIFPNPFGDNLVIQLPAAEPIALINSQGKLVMTKESSLEHYLSVANLERGVYILRIGEGRSLRYRKVMKS